MYYEVFYAYAQLPGRGRGGSTEREWTLVNQHNISTVSAYTAALVFSR